MGGALALRFAADHPHRPAGLVLVNPAVATDRKDVKLLPVLKHVIPSMPGIANDIKKSGVEEHGYTRTPLRAADSMFRGYKELCGDLGRDHLPGADLPVHRRPRRRPVLGPHHPGHDRLRRRTRGLLENSYHVATLDNDAERIFEGSAAFIERVSGAVAGG